ncbi:MAG: SLC13 family permease [Omnitrophica WOR_2 bacterium]
MGISQSFIILALIIATAVLFLINRFRPDVIALLVLAILGITGLVNPRDLFSGFSSSAVLTILAISIISEGLRQTGVTRQLGSGMRRLGGQQEWRLVLATMLTAALLSLFMNNIAVVSVLLPVVTGLTRQSRVMPSRLLMPLAYGTILGGMATLLTTSNIIVNSSLRAAGYRSFGLLDFLPVGVPVIIIGIVYMLLVGRRLLPQRYPAGEVARARRIQLELANLYGIDKNLHNLVVLPDSILANRSLKQGEWMKKFGLWVVGIKHYDRFLMAPSPDDMVWPGDIILTRGELSEPELINAGLQLLPDHVMTYPVSDGGMTLSEIAFTPHSILAGKSLREIQFREKYGLSVLAIWRRGKPLQEKMADTPLQFGDALLVQGPSQRLAHLKSDRNFIVMEEDPMPVYKPGKTNLAVIITLLTLGFASLGYLPVAEVSLVGAVLMLITDCLSLDDAYRSIEWRLIFLIAGMWPLSIAIQSSGLADQITRLFLQQYGMIPLTNIALIVLVLALILTQLMGSQVASLVLIPFAFSANRFLGIDPRSLGMAIALGCSLAFITPHGHPINVAIMSPGGYTSRDFLRVGAPLTILVMLTILFGLHHFWGL